jgi:hypothetical protein
MPQNKKPPKRQTRPPNTAAANSIFGNIKQVPSLLDAMVDGSEFASIADLVLPSKNLMVEFRAALADIEAIRGRPCVAYVGNVVRPLQDSSVDAADDLPFEEMVKSVSLEHKKIDVFLATLGGLGQQVARFVNCLRPRFDEVDFLIPSMAMSAGTLFAMSGDSIWMNPQAALGPVDPQVPTRDGRYVPAQALLSLVNQCQNEGQQAINAGQHPPWTSVRIIDSIDKKELGDAMTASQYALNMTSKFLENYKFQHWVTKESSRQPVTPADRTQRALAIAQALVSHDKWKSHGHSISREVLWQEINLRIDHPDFMLERSIRRFWALLSYTFAKTLVQKIMVSKDYGHVRHLVQQGVTQ